MTVFFLPFFWLLLPNAVENYAYHQQQRKMVLLNGIPKKSHVSASAVEGCATNFPLHSMMTLLSINFDIKLLHRRGITAKELTAMVELK